MNKFNDDEGFEEVFGKANRKGRSFPPGLAEQMGSGMIMLAIGSDGPAFPGMSNPLVTGDELAYHDGSQILLPEGMAPGQARRIFDRLEVEQETETKFDISFRYRPDDGAHATAQVIKRRYGMSIGEKIDMGFFGTKPPETRTIKVGVDETVQVPWGLISIPTLPGLKMLFCDGHPDPELGPVFDLHVTAPRKYKKEIEEFFAEVEQYLKEHSIYRGKAVVGTNKPEFLDFNNFDRTQIVFADDVNATLNRTVWAVMRHTDALREEGVPRKRAVLLHGPFGTGKSSAGIITALEAVANGWTFIAARPGRDKAEDVLRLARLYSPAVVFIEDIDNETASGVDNEVTRFLDAFDGISAKDGELIAMLTSNHLERIHQGMLRPGRFDAIVEVSGLDRAAVERLIKSVVKPGKLDPSVDFDAVHNAMAGFLPAFAKEVLIRAITDAIDRLDGQLNYVLTTENLVEAAVSLQPQYQAFLAANEGERPPTLDQTFQDAVTRAAQGVVHGTVLDGSGGITLSVPALNGNSH